MQIGQENRHVVSFIRRHRAIVIWGVFLFIAFQLAFLLARERWWPALADPEYGRKLARLRAKLRKEPHDRPLILMLGSSRVTMGFRPRVLQINQAPTRESPLVFNFGFCGFGPVGELLSLRRLLADGIRPNAVLIEIFTPFIAHEDDLVDCFDINRLRWRDESLFRRYVHKPEDLRVRWWKAQLTPWFSHRRLTINHLAPTWLPAGDRIDFVNWQGMDGWGWVGVPGWDKPAEPTWFSFLKNLLVQQYSQTLGDWHVTGTADRSLQEILSLCRKENIAAGLLLMPEISFFRDWYSPPSRTRLTHFLDELGKARQVPVFDASRWIADDGFVEGIHLTHVGAVKFTTRFEREVLPFFLASLEKRLAKSPERRDN